MKRIVKIIMLAISLFPAACKDEPWQVSCVQGELATVKDLTGLDGCGFVFELADGTLLEPQRIFYCGTPPLPKEATEDPLLSFHFVDGKQVKIGFNELPNAASICMVGKVVKIICIEEIDSITEQ